MLVLLGLGSNLEPDSYINLALIKLRIAFGDLQESRRYRTPSVGFVGPSFINMAIALDTDFSPEEVIRICQKIERELGRDRSKESGSCSRCIDIDLLLFELDQDENWSIPEPRADIAKFAYTAVPLADLIPDWSHEISDALPLREFIKSRRFSEQKIEVIS